MTSRAGDEALSSSVPFHPGETTDRGERVTEWLSTEWFDRARALASGLPERPGLSARIQQQLTGGPEGDVSCYWVLEDGRPTSAALGSVGAADLTLTMSWADAAAIQDGSLDPSVAFMQGRMKVAGSMEAALALLAGHPEPRVPGPASSNRRVHRTVNARCTPETPWAPTVPEPDPPSSGRWMDPALCSRISVTTTPRNTRSRTTR